MNKPCKTCGQPLDDYHANIGHPDCSNCVRAADQADPVSHMKGMAFTALYKGERYRFRTAEHFNIGPGWMCWELDGALPRGVYGSHEMTDVQSLGEVIAPYWARGLTPHRRP